MKRVFILSLILLLCVGCTRIDDTENYSTITDEIIKSDKKEVNTTALGYKYYLPIGVEKVYDKDYNQKLKYEDTYIYLYVDAVSYYYRNSLNFEEQDVNSYYYQKINQGEKIGYIKITKEKENSYFIKIVYNYAKIEAYATENNKQEVLANSLIILNSIDYNDNLIKKILEDEYFSSDTKDYKIKKSKDTESKFREYLSEYVQEEENQIPDLPEY